jgi:thiamine kinase-like enzyme
MGAIVGTMCMHGCVEPMGCGAFTALPWKPEQLTAETMTEILRRSGTLPMSASVQSVTRKIFGEGEGLMSVMYRLSLDYGADADEAWPRSLVAKVTPPSLKPRIVGELLDLFKTEVQFYDEHISERTGVPTANVFHAAHGGHGRYMLILEDLAPAKCGDQISGLSAEQAQAALTAIAPLHAKYWNAVHEEEETQDWVRPMNNLDYWKLVKKTFTEAAVKIYDRLELFGIDCESLPNFLAFVQHLDETFDDFIDLSCNDYKAVNKHALFSTTLCHGDFRGENIFYTVGTSEGVKLIDFQLVREAVGSEDVSYFVVGSMTIEERRRCEVQLIQHYVNELQRLGVTDLSMAEALLTFQFGFVITIIINTIALSDTEGGNNERGKRLLAAMLERLEAAMVDWQFMDAWKLRCSKVGDDHVTERYTQEELLQSLPIFVHPLLS